MASPEPAYAGSTGSTSAMSWGAVFAGAAIAAAVSLILLDLGTGLGLSAISPWAHRGVSASAFGVSSIVWLIVTQLCASALGGYLAGRLRTRWVAMHTDEVYFRDTAQGLLAWAVATLITAAILLGATSNLVGAAAQATATVASGAVGSMGAVGTAKAGSSSMDYLVDSLFRKDPATPASVPASVGALTVDVGPANAGQLPLPEVRRIFVNASQATTLPAQDVRYLGQLVAQRTGLQQADAERRVTETYAALQANISNAKAAAADAAEKARKAGIQIALWLFIALLSGAFIASYTAMLGGRERDA